jgi:hypothetical protein
MRISDLVAQLQKTQREYGDDHITQIVTYGKDVILIKKSDYFWSIGTSDGGISLDVVAR